jgi:hypothetical protein
MSDDELSIPGAEAEQKKPPKKSAKRMLMDMAADKYAFGRDDSGRAFALARDGGPVAVSIPPLMRKLAAELYSETGDIVSRTAQSEVGAILEGQALSSDPETLSLRVGRESETGDIIIDLGDATERYIRVNADGWSVSQTGDQTTVMFRRGIGLPLPRPRKCPPGREAMRLKRLRSLLNMSDENWHLLVGFMVTTFIPDIPHPILYIKGVHGSAKSDAQDAIVMMLDPNNATRRSLPRDERHWSQSAKASYVVSFDNVSHIQPWQSDKLCMAATGSGDVDRMLYTDDESIVTKLQRVLVFNGIGVTGIRSDLADRLLTVSLQPISKEARKKEADIKAEFEAAQPYVLGALLNVLSQAMSIHANGEAEMDQYPRMADFAEWLRAVDLVLGTKALEKFMEENDELAVDVAENDRIIGYVRAYIGLYGQKGTAKLTATEWVEALRSLPNGMPEKLCSHPQSFTSALQRAEQGLRLAGWTLRQWKSGSRRGWEITLPPSEEGAAEKAKIIQMRARTGTTQGRGGTSRDEAK